MAAWVALAVMAPAAGAGAQVILHNNADPANPIGDQGLAPALVTGSGQAAPQGALWSEVQAFDALSVNSVAGFSNLEIGGAGYRFADDFTIPPGSGWTLSSAEFYVYQPGYAGSPPPVGAATLRVWSGRPGEAGSVVVLGDTTTNRLVGAQETNVYRIFNTTSTPVTPPDVSRRVWRVALALNDAQLPPGVYWLDWQFSATDPTGELYSPPVTITGRLNKPRANARVLAPLPPPSPEGVWGDLADPGKPISSMDTPQDLPFVILGYGVQSSCPADLTGIGGPPTPPDGQLTLDDILAFVNAFGEGAMMADVCGVGGPPTLPDHQLTLDDLLAFVNAFGEGC